MAFNEQAYLAANPDVAAHVKAGGGSAFDHYQQYGQAEGRGFGPATQSSSAPVVGSNAGWGAGSDVWFQKEKYWEDPEYQRQLTANQPNIAGLVAARNPTGVGVGQQRSDGAVWDGARWTDPQNYSNTLDPTMSLDWNRGVRNNIGLDMTLNNTGLVYGSGAGAYDFMDQRASKAYMSPEANPLTRGNAYFAADGSLVRSGSGVAATNDLWGVGQGGGIGGGSSIVNAEDRRLTNPNWVPNKGLSSGTGVPFGFTWGQNGQMNTIQSGSMSGGSGGATSSPSGGSYAPGGGSSSGGSSFTSSGAPSLGFNLSDVSGPSQWDVSGNQTVANQLTALMASDNPLIQQARARAMQQSNARGLSNSSIAQTAGDAAAYDAMMQIAKQDAGTNATAAQSNTAAKNQFTTDANAFLRNGYMADFNLSANEWAAQQDFARQQQLARLQAELDAGRTTTQQKDSLQQGYINALNQARTAWSDKYAALMADPNMSPENKTSALTSLAASYNTQIKQYTGLLGWDYGSWDIEYKADAPATAPAATTATGTTP